MRLLQVFGTGAAPSSGINVTRSHCGPPAAAQRTHANLREININGSQLTIDE